MKPSILVVTQLYPNVTNSFLGTFVVQQLEHMKAHYTIVVITVHKLPFSMQYGHGVALRQPRYEARHGIHVYSLPHMPYWLEWPGYLLNRGQQDCFHKFQLATDKLLVSHKIQRLARKLHDQYHFSLVHGHETYVGDETASVGRLLRIPSVFTLHGLYRYHLQGFGERVMRRAVTNLNATNRLVAVSQLAAQSYRDQGVRRSFEIIPNGVRHPEESHLDVPKEIQALTRGKTVLLTVGFFVPEKRIEYSVKTLARLHANGLKDTVLLIIGKGVLERELRKRIQQENLTDVVRIIGEVAPEDMWGYYSITDVLLHPSTVESFSMVCLEAMSYGKPIVCTSNIGLVEFLQPGRDAVVVPPDDPSALYEAVLRLVRNPSLRRTIGRRAEKTAQNLSWPAQVRKLRRTYEEMLGDVGSR